MNKSWLKYGVMLLALCMVLFLTKHEVGGPNDAARMATIQALVEQHTFALDSSILVSNVDIMSRNGHAYSDKPPMLQFLGAIAYSPLYHMGIQFGNHYNIVYYLLTFLLAGIPYLIILYLMLNLLEMFNVSTFNWFIMYLLTAMGTLLFPFSFTFNNHLLTAMFIMMASYLWITSEKQHAAIKHLPLWLGILTAFAVTLELPTGGICLIGFFVLVLLHHRKDWYVYILGACIPLAVHFILNYHQTGDMIPAYLHKEFYQFKDSFWGGELGKKRMFGASIPGQYFHMLIGYRGLFLFSPILILGFYQAVKDSVCSRNYLRELGSLTVVLLLGTISSYAFQISDFGGGSYGLRWVIAAIPLLLFFTLRWLEENQSRVSRWSVMGLLAISLTIGWIGVYNPWPQNAVTPIPFLENIVYMTFHPPAPTTVIAEKILEHTSLDKGLAYYELGREAWKQNQLDTAVYYMKISLKYDPKPTLIYYQLGLLLDLSGHPEDAITTYQTLLKLEPDNTGAENNMAAFYLHAGRFDDAAALYQKIITQFPDKLNSRLAYSQVLLNQEKYPEALEQVRYVLKREPDNLSAQHLYTEIKSYIDRY